MHKQIHFNAHLSDQEAQLWFHCVQLSFLKQVQLISENVTKINFQIRILQIYNKSVMWNSVELNPMHDTFPLMFSWLWKRGTIAVWPFSFFSGTWYKIHDKEYQQSTATISMLILSHKAVYEAATTITFPLLKQARGRHKYMHVFSPNIEQKLI